MARSTPSTPPYLTVATPRYLIPATPPYEYTCYTSLPLPPPLTLACDPPFCLGTPSLYRYVFLLKGHEDLRQDERVMQLFGLVSNHARCPRPSTSTAFLPFHPKSGLPGLTLPAVTLPAVTSVVNPCFCGDIKLAGHNFRFYQPLKAK